METNRKMLQSILTLVYSESLHLVVRRFAKHRLVLRIPLVLGVAGVQVRCVVDGQAAYHNSGTTAMVQGVELYNMVKNPRGANGIVLDVKIKNDYIQNKGSSKGSLYVQFVRLNRLWGKGPM